MPRKRRNTQEELIMFKQYIVDQCIQRKMKHTDGATALKMHPKAFSRLKRRYLEYGIAVLVPKKPGPKAGSTSAYNRTPNTVEDVVVAYALRYPFLGPTPLADKLADEQHIHLDSTTIWRILKRRKVRYTREYKRWRDDPTLYCLEKPGIELQMDGSYPYGRARGVVLFDAIDDCSRWVYGRLYAHEDAESAIDFVTHLMQRTPFRIQRIRVDNRYGDRFVQFCKTLGIAVHENTPYTPKENGKIERFHKTIKRELFWRHCSYHDTTETLAYKLSQYLAYYNTHRRHRGYGMNRQTPAQKIASTLLQSISLSYPQKLTLSLQPYIP